MSIMQKLIALLLLPSCFFSVLAAPPTQAPTDHMAAHWVTPSQLLLPPESELKGWILYSGDTPEQSTSLVKGQGLAKVKPGYLHLKHWQPLTINLPQRRIKQWLTGGIYVYNTITKSHHQVQTAWLLDELYTSAPNDANEYTKLGASLTADGTQFALWAPTAKAINVAVFNADKSFKTKIEMNNDRATGIWSVQSTKVNMLDYYHYEITAFHPSIQQTITTTVTDPYSLSLSINSQYSQVIDLNHATTQPDGWNSQARPALSAPEKQIIYELHVGDFSGTDGSVSQQYRGSYEAFSETQSHGYKHLQSLAEAGLNTIHLLPVFDIATINEDRKQRLHLDDSLTTLCRLMPDVELCRDDSYSQNQQLTVSQYLQQMSVNSADAQALIEQIRAVDDYNWGYDPLHYTVPEGSYSHTPEGSERIVSFRTMVQALHRMGFRVVMDVVYNHTHSSGLHKHSILDKIVPGYYQRLHPLTGQVEQSTCCANTATERAMMAKLMTDSLQVWARDYAIDGFRFDLMGHQPKATMLAARQAVQRIDKDNYFYGEGWNFGEVANDQRFVQASQLNLSNTEIGTFSDRLRDAIRGPGFNISGHAIRANQGIGNGLMTMPNEAQDNTAIARHDNAWALLATGLAGNLKTFQWYQNGKQQTGHQIPYGDAPAAYAEDPADTIHYVSKHDNQTLWDNHQYRLPFDTTIQQRLRIHAQSLSFPLISQGIPFLHMGSELARSKSFLRDSYDYGHWFNAVDFSYTDNNYHKGLPPAAKDQNNWSLIRQVIDNNAGNDDVKPEHIVWLNGVFQDWLRIRTSSPLFSLTSAEAIHDSVKVTQHPKKLGAMTLLLDDSQHNDDARWQKIAVLINTQPEPVVFKLTMGWGLHPVQRNGHDRVLNTISVTDGNVTVPGFTNLVLVKAAR